MTTRMTTPLQQQFEALIAENPGSTLQPLPNGTSLISIPNFQLPGGWSSRTTTVRFLAPVGYPHSRPDCFWVDADVRLAGGGTPKASRQNPIPEYPGPFWWFSWHVGHWHPNRDNLLTFVRCIEARFRDAQ